MWQEEGEERKVERSEVVASEVGSWRCGGKEGEEIGGVEILTAVLAMMDQQL